MIGPAPAEPASRPFANRNAELQLRRWSVRPRPSRAHLGRKTAIVGRRKSGPFFARDAASQRRQNDGPNDALSGTQKSIYSGPVNPRAHPTRADASLAIVGTFLKPELDRQNNR